MVPLFSGLWGRSLIEIKVSFVEVWSLTSSATVRAATTSSCLRLLVPLCSFLVKLHGSTTTSSWMVLLLFISLVSRRNLNFGNFFLFLSRLLSLLRLALMTFLSLFLRKFFNFLFLWLFRSRLGDFLLTILRLIGVTSLSALAIVRLRFRLNLNPLFFLDCLSLSLRIWLPLVRSALDLLGLSSRSKFFWLFLTFNLGTFALAFGSRFWLLFERLFFHLHLFFFLCFSRLGACLALSLGFHFDWSLNLPRVI